MEMLWDQIKASVHPTWGELAKMIYLPRSPEQAQSAAQEILDQHGKKMKRLRELSQLVQACGKF